MNTVDFNRYTLKFASDYLFFNIDPVIPKPVTKKTSTTHQEEPSVIVPYSVIPILRTAG